jgi:glycyl-tRNA synthetase beta chain
VRTQSLVEPAEIALHQVLAASHDSVQAAIAARRYTHALQALTGLRVAVHDFFEHVMVMDEDVQRRDNRLALLRGVADLLGGVADLSRLPG